MDVRANVFISGRVQGVFFRAYTRDKARALGLKGWVKNLYDGRVEAVFEGEKERVKEMLEWCHEGPSAAKVTNLEIKFEQATREFSNFDVRY